MNKIQLKHKKSDPGFCREYYTFVYKGKKRLCCIQDNSAFGRVRFELLGCTSDGEPEAQLKLELFEIPEQYQGKIIHD